MKHWLSSILDPQTAVNTPDSELEAFITHLHLKRINLEQQSLHAMKLDVLKLGPNVQEDMMKHHNETSKLLPNIQILVVKLLRLQDQSEQLKT